jgi:peptidyl-prolyl cis-trans isomerase A (cyclophilin A)
VRLMKWALVLFLLLPLAAHATVVRLQTVLGAIDIALLDSEAPRTVANFLSYVNSGAYNSSFIQRSVPFFVIQGGGYTMDNADVLRQITAGPPVANEFSATRSNLRGTIAMAKVSGNPDSATNQWFINLADNSANLDSQNGGFTVFGRVAGSGMAVVDAIAALQTVNTSTITNLPVTSVPASGQVGHSQLVMVTAASVLPGAGTANDSDRLFNYLEAAYPRNLAPASQPTNTGVGYVYRYYPATSAYVGTANGTLYYLGPASVNALISLGTLADWLAVAARAGY